MVRRYTIRNDSTTQTGRQVEDNHFGANALHRINIDPSGDHAPLPGFRDAVADLGINHLRYPGGHVENTIDITRLENGQLRPEVRAFFDWCRESGADGIQQNVTVVLPTKTDIPASQIQDFVYRLLAEYGDLVHALEIGNEYSIGPTRRDPDRSSHPEENPDGDFVASMDETAYGITANRVINAAQDAIDRLSAERGTGAPDPAILIQMGDSTGGGSAYKGTGSIDGPNRAIIDQLDWDARASIDGAVAHYYYNVGHEDGLAFDNDWRETRRMQERHENFTQHFGREVDFYITEWNVVNSNYSQHGAPSASVLLEMFEFMVQVGVSDAHIWPLQHRTQNTVAGNWSTDEADLSMSGAAFAMLSDSLRPQRDAEIGREIRFESILGDWSGQSGEIEVNHFASVYEQVFYVSSRMLERADVVLDLQRWMDGATAVDLRQLTIDRASADGLSDFADENGHNRGARRVIDQAELDQLATLGFFDWNNPNHVRIEADGKILTYLPAFETIIPLVTNPRGIDDYYIAGEADVDPLITRHATDALFTGQVQARLMPFDVLEITVSHVWRQDGSDGADVMSGGHGQDVILGRLGNDYIAAGEHDDTVKGGWGNDTLFGGSGDDWLVGGHDADTLYGGAGNDSLHGGEGNDLAYGGEGWDVFQIDLMRDAVTVETGPGETGGQTVTIVSAHGRDVLDGIEAIAFGTELTGIEIVEFESFGTGSPAHDGTAHDGTAGRDRLEAPEPGALLRGHDGRDTLMGSSGDDTLEGGAGRDLALGAAGRDSLDGGIENDTLYGGDGDDRLSGGDGDDLLGGGDGDDMLSGGAGSDRVFGSHGNDVVNGDAGDDTLGGARGDDVLSGGDGQDKVWGSHGNDTLSGNAGNDTLGGFRGNDWLDGGEGDDAVWGAFGDDILFGGDGNDRLGGASGADTIEGGAGDDRIFGGADADMLRGGVGHDSIFGAEGDDDIKGGGGDDLIWTGDGYDTIRFRPGDGTDTIRDFDALEDRLHIDAALADGRDVLTIAMSAERTDDGILLDLGQGTAVLLEADMSMLGLAGALDIG